MTTVFFSWQSDRSTKTGRNLVDRALREAIADLKSDAELEEAVREELQLDRDTQGLPGSPPIVDAIFRKIDAAAVFVPDLTFVGTRPDGRPTPNPNVLIEYGWALKALSYDRIVPVMNEAYGPPTGQSMPFDMAHLRFPITYNCPENAGEDERKTARGALRKALTSALKAVLAQYTVLESAPEPFSPKESVGKPSRFRRLDEPLGQTHNAMPGQPASDVLIENAPAMWLRVMPRFATDKVFSTLDLERVVYSNSVPSPLNCQGGSLFLVRSADGYGVYVSPKASTTPAAFFVFRTGETWTWDSTYLASDPSKVYLSEAHFNVAFKEACKVLTKLGFESPYAWIAGVEGIKGRVLAATQRVLPFGAHKFLTDVVTVQGVAAAEDPEPLKPFFEKVFAEAHQSR